jgi:hypothetical protein
VRNIDLFLPGVVDQQQSSGWYCFGHRVPFEMERFRFWSLQISHRCSSFSAKKTALRYPYQDSVEVRTLGLRRLVEN